MTEDQSAITAKEFEALVGVDVPSFYFNGFQNGAGNSDVTSVLQKNGRPVCVLNMSFTTAKTLSVLLGQLIAQIEAETGQEIMTTHRIGAAMSESQNNKDEA